MKNKKQIALVIGSVVLAGAIYYFFKNRALKKKYNIVNDRGFEIMIAKE